MVLFYDLPGDRQAKSCAAVLGCIERFEDPLYICFIYATAGIGKGNDDIIFFQGCRDSEFATVDHRCAGIENEVYRHLADLVAVDR